MLSACLARPTSPVMRTTLFALILLLGCASPESDAMTQTGCTPLFDFSDAADRDAWSVQNDTVMGGNSRGEMTLAGDALVFEGTLVTRGGGFVQVQAPLPAGALSGMTALRIEGESGGRPWEARVQTDVRVPRAAMRGYGDEGERAIGQSGPGLDGPRVSFASPLGDFEDGITTADFAAPDASTRGRPVPGATWDASAAQSLGLILADGQDGPYRLVVRTISVCR